MTTAWRNRIVGHGDVAPDQLLANPRNWRTHLRAQQRALAGALTEVGWVPQVLVNRTTGNLVDGHLRVELAISRGEPTVPVTYVELTEDEERVVLASLRGRDLDRDVQPGLARSEPSNANRYGQA